MTRVTRVILAAALGGVASALLTSLMYSARSEVVFEMDRDLPSFASGFYPVERAGDQTFAWTWDRAVIRLAGLDRRVAWRCSWRMRAARGPELPLPTLTLSFDSAGGRTTDLTNDFQDIVVDVPPRPERSGLTLTATLAPMFVPGNGDSRVLGAQVERIACEPSGWAWAPRAALKSAAVGGAAFAGLVALLGIPLAAGAVIVGAITAGYAVLLSTGNGAFGAYPSLIMWVALAAAGAGAAVAFATRTFQMSTSTAAIVVCASAGFACLKLGALAHPAKPLIDAVFQAHRLQWVLSGRYFFTQPLPDGVQFPYAIGLYVTAAPLASLVTDYVFLLRLIVVAVEAVAGGLLYMIVVRGFGDRLAGLLAVVLFHLVPLPYIVVGNANLTNAFAQGVASISLVVLAQLAAGSVRWRWGLLVLVGLTAAAFLSHVSTAALLAGTLAAVAAAYAASGVPCLRRASVGIIGGALLAALLAVGLYYRHFSDVYAHAWSRVRTTQQTELPAARQERPEGTPDVLVRQLTWRERAAKAAGQTRSDIGWPVLALAAVGAWRLMHGRWREPVPLLLIAWCGVWGAFLFAGTLTRVDTQYQRYAAEFLGRVNLACYPAAAVLAGMGAAGLWRTRTRAWTGFGGLLLAAAVLAGARAWFGWFS